MSTDCLFCKIILKQIPATIQYEDEKCVAFADIHPKDSTHIIITPREHIPTVADATEQQEPLLGHLLVTAKKLAQERNLAGYKLQFNVGKEGGQEIFHLHLHLIGH
jgi:histidine triad (HIT) family protein